MGERVNEAPTIRRYTAADAADWDAFVTRATNATFLHLRDFMDYHADRFEDHSLIIEIDGKIQALLPANEKNEVLASHGGLTYGGLLVLPRLPAAQVVEILEAIRDYIVGQGLQCLIYKPSPHIFHTQPSEADQYALVNAGARLVRADLGTAIPIPRRQPFNTLRKRGTKKALKAGLEIRESGDFSAFWAILSEVLETRHEAAPTHSLEEITLLAGRFPDQIRLWGSFEGEEMLAGMVLFDCGQTVHAQYIAATSQGRNCGALDLLVHHLLGEVFADRDWFSFGISTTNAGRDLNIGLSRQKEMFGGQSVMFPQYQWDVA